jgi:hypothetical protein
MLGEWGIDGQRRKESLLDQKVTRKLRKETASSKTGRLVLEGHTPEAVQEWEEEQLQRLAEGLKPIALVRSKSVDKPQEEGMPPDSLPLARAETEPSRSPPPMLSIAVAAPPPLPLVVGRTIEAEEGGAGRRPEEDGKDRGGAGRRPEEEGKDKGGQTQEQGVEQHVEQPPEAPPQEQPKSSQEEAPRPDNGPVLTYDELVAQRNSADLDPTRLHTYLSEREFQRVFGLSKGDFEKQPRWKQIKQRKQAGLF